MNLVPAGSPGLSIAAHPKATGLAADCPAPLVRVVGIARRLGKDASVENKAVVPGGMRPWIEAGLPLQSFKMPFINASFRRWPQRRKWFGA